MIIRYLVSAEFCGYMPFCIVMCVCLASPPSPDLLNISCDRISWNSIRIRIGLIYSYEKKKRMNGVVQGWAAFSSANVFSARGPLLAGWQCDSVVPAGLALAWAVGRSLPGLYHLLFLHVLQQDMLVVLPFSLLFRSRPRGEGWKGSEAHQLLILWDLVKSRMSNYLLHCQKLT